MSGDREITAELYPVDLAPPQPASGHLCLTFAAKTDLGRVRENNEDKFDFWEPEDPESLSTRGRLYAVADGMGGHAAGQIASEMALKAFGEAYYASSSGPVEEALVRSVAKANALVHDIQQAVPSRHGMGCTLVAAAVVGTDVVVVWAGDSRAYRVHDGAIDRLTDDHSWVWERVRAGVLTPEEAETHPHRNIITRSIGPEAGVTPEVRRFPLAEGDVLVLCSDGLTGAVRDEEIAGAVRGSAPTMACQDLIALANERGGPDNVTVAVVRVDRVTEEGPQPPVPKEAVSEPAPEAPKRTRWGLFGR